MPPSITSRQSPQSLTHHDEGARPRGKQALSDFRARKKLLAGREGKKTKKKQAKEGVAKKTAPSEAEPSSAAASPSVAAAPLDTSTSSALLSTGGYGGLGAGLGYGGMMGMGGGMMGMGGMYGSPYGMGMGTGPLNSLNQFLFGIQTAIYSLSSAVQVIGMNTQALHQLLDAASSMVDHALATWHEMRALEASANEQETEEQKMRRRRLKALRYAMAVAGTYAAYRLMKSALSSRKQGRRRRLPSSDPYNSSSNYASTPYSNSPYSSGYSMSPYNSSGTGMYDGGGAYGMGYGGGGYY